MGSAMVAPLVFCMLALCVAVALATSTHWLTVCFTDTHTSFVP